MQMKKFFSLFVLAALAVVCAADDGQKNNLIIGKT